MSNLIYPVSVDSLSREFACNLMMIEKFYAEKVTPLSSAEFSFVKNGMHISILQQ